MAEVTGYSRDWVYKLVRQYNEAGPSALGDKRHDNPGAPPLLNDVQQAQLLQALEEEPFDGDLGDGPKVAQWMSELLGHRVHPQRGWDYLKALEMRLVKLQSTVECGHGPVKSLSLLLTRSSSGRGYQGLSNPLAVKPTGGSFPE